VSRQSAAEETLVGRVKFLAAAGRSAWTSSGVDRWRPRHEDHDQRTTTAAAAELMVMTMN